MPTDPRPDDLIDPEDVNSLPNPDDDSTGTSDPNDEIPVPIVMSAAEIDERAQVVEALRGNAPPPKTNGDDPRLEA